MGKYSRMWRSGLSLLLALCMVVGLCPVVTFAEETEPEKTGLNYVSLGDSMSNGYGLDGYMSDTGVYGYGYDSYANQFADWLKGEKQVDEVHHAQLAMSGMRVEDLHWLLELDYENESLINAIDELDNKSWDGMTEEERVNYVQNIWNGMFAAGDYRTWDQMCDNYRMSHAAAFIVAHNDAINGTNELMEKYGINAADLAKTDNRERRWIKTGETAIVAKEYQESVKNADVITLAIGNGNFGVYMFGDILDAIGFYGEDNIEDPLRFSVDRAISECEPEMQVLIKELIAEIHAAVEPTVNQIVSDGEHAETSKKALMNIVTYTGVSFVLNYAGCVEAILQLNPDAEIVMLGLMNTFAGPKTRSLEGMTMGDLLEAVYTPLNAFIAGLPATMQKMGNSVYDEGTFYYAEADYIECNVATYGNDFYKEDNTSNYDSIIRDRFVREIVGGGSGMIWGLLGGMEIQGKKIQPVAKEEIFAYDDLSDVQKAASAAQNPEKAMSIAVYLAFEKAILATKGGAPVPLDSVLGLGNLDASLFSGVMDTFMANVGAAGAAYIDAASTVVAAGSGGLLTPEQVKALVGGGENANAVYYAIVEKKAEMPAGTVANVIAENDAGKAFLYAQVEAQTELPEGAVASIIANDDIGKNYLYEIVAKQLNFKPEEVAQGVAEGNADMVDAVAYARQAIIDGVATAKQTVVDGVASAKATIEEFDVVGNANMLCMLLAIPDTLGAAIATDASLEGLMGLFSRCIIGDGVGSHPSSAGYDVLFTAVKTAYEENYTANDRASENLARIIDLVIEEMHEKWPDLDYEIVELLEKKYDLDRERDHKAAQLEKEPGNEDLQKEIADLEKQMDDIDDRIGVLRGEVTTNLVYSRDCADSLYVALGDRTSVSESYADKLAQELDVEYVNLSETGLTVLDTYGVLEENTETIAAADLITLGYGTNLFFQFAVEQILAEMSNEREALDWKTYVGADGLKYVGKIRATVEGKLLEKGLTDEMSGHTMAHLLTVAIESYVYCCVSYAWNLPELINAIRVINDDAQILIIGMYNPMKDKYIVGENMTLPLGDYIDYIVDGVEIHSLAYAMMSDNCMYVHAPDVAIDYSNTELNMLGFLSLYMKVNESVYPNEAGHTYIKDQIMEALNETIIDHADENADHLCDKCKKTLSACADEDQDHLCDYAGCGKELSECIDADKDHACDNGCDKVYGEHADEDKDHDCDYGCEETFGECEDEDQDHVCDYGCDRVYGEHTDTNQDHKCEYCDEAITKCRDTDDDHICDICGKKVLRCVDKDDDHKCDDCGKVISECEDTNKDHECDTCGKELSKCEDANQDHKCDTCKTELSNCADTDKDHICDTCGETIDAHTDADADGKCDTCGSSVGSDEETVTVTGVTRISGKDRTATARKIADELKAITGTEKFDAIVYASGDVFADALAGTYLANMENAPILLYRAGSEEANQEYIVENLNEGGFVYILGGTKAIPAAVDTALRNAGVQVVRLSGKTRIETNIEILEETGFAGGETVLVCTGYEYADSLSASATGMPILLVEKGAEYLRDAQIDYLKSLDAECDFVVIGGTAAVTADLVEALEAYDADGEVERLSGKTRYETSIKLAETFFTSDRIVLAYGREFADGLCGGTLAYTLGVPVVLAEESMADVVAEYTKEAKITSGYVLGGTARLTDKPVRTIFQMAASDEIVVK